MINWNTQRNQLKYNEMPSLKLEMYKVVNLASISELCEKYGLLILQRGGLYFIYSLQVRANYELAMDSYLAFTLSPTKNPNQNDEERQSES